MTHQSSDKPRCAWDVDILNTICPRHGVPMVDCPTRRVEVSCLPQGMSDVEGQHVPSDDPGAT